MKLTSEKRAEIKEKLIAIDNCTTNMTLQGSKQYIGRFINRFQETYGTPDKFDMGEDAGLYIFALETYRGLHI